MLTVEAALVLVGTQTQLDGDVRDAFHAQLLCHLDEGSIRAGRQRFLQRHVGLVGARVFHAVLVRRAAGCAACTHAFHLGAGGHGEVGVEAHAVLQRRRSCKDLEHGAGAVPLQRVGQRQHGFPLVLAQAVLARGGHGQHLMLATLGRDVVRRGGYALLVRGDLAAGGRLRMLLRLRIQRGADGVAALGYLVLGDPLVVQVLQHVIAEESGATGADTTVGGHLRLLQHAQRLTRQLIRLGLRKTIRVHARLQHGIAPLLRTLRVGVRVQRAGGLHDSGQEGRLIVVQIRRVHAEIGLRRGLHAEGAVAEGDQVQIARQDLVLS